MSSVEGHGTGLVNALKDLLDKWELAVVSDAFCFGPEGVVVATRREDATELRAILNAQHSRDNARVYYANRLAAKANREERVS